MPLRYAYALISAASGPALRALLAKRSQRGKEDPQRLGERMGQASHARPDGKLLWFHAASVGESQTVLPLIEALLDRDPGLHILMTTGTRTSAKLLAHDMPSRAFHQYAPLDNPQWINRFLDHWSPDAAVWVESELWPNMIGLTSERGIALGLVNARLSARSARRWRRIGRGFFASLLGRFGLILAQDDDSARRLQRDLGVDVGGSANLKQLFDRPRPLPSDIASKLETLRAQPLRWLAASTHPGEEALVYQAAQTLKDKFPGLLTVLAPRHPERLPELLNQAKAAGLRVVSLSDWQPGEALDVLMIDRLGLLKQLYGYLPISFVGGSMNLGLGGHNVFEALRAPTALLFGPDMSNLRADADALLAQGAAREVTDGGSLTSELSNLLADSDQQAAMHSAAASYNMQDQHRAEAVVQALEALLAGRYQPGDFERFCQPKPKSSPESLPEPDALLNERQTAPASGQESTQDAAKGDRHG